ncbi:MAG TPA: hypothetical protein VGE52_18210 [Pirellulales bacterium]
MRGLIGVILAIALTAASWGVYGPVLHWGAEAMGHSRLRPFVCVGLAYFVLGVLIPGVIVFFHGEKGRWTLGGTIWSFVAGIATAIGAFGVILAMNAGGNPIYVMPLIFGGAPVVNTLFTMATTRGARPSPIFIAGLIVVALGAVTVLAFKPAPAKAPAATAAAAHEEVKPGTTVTKTTTVTTTTKPAEPVAPDSPAAHAQMANGTREITFEQLVMVSLFVALTAVCWGIYGPILHWGQMAMEQSRWRPLICVGVAYCLVAVMFPLALLQGGAEAGGDWGDGPTGVFWSLLGGAAGAFGSLGIILAFNAGGKPIYVMPLVFGIAPVINVLTSISTSNVQTPNPLFYAGLILVVGGAITVLVFAPKGGKPTHPPAPPTPPAPPAPPEATTEEAIPTVS